MQKSEKIKRFESLRNQNHDLFTYRLWLTQFLPQHVDLHKIQVAGTNGKGSSAHWLHDLLVGSGYKVGLFTSPHLIQHTERIQINGEEISWQDWERIYDQYASFFEQNQFTMFEVDCWMATAYFLEQEVDIAIMEVGLGGRLDATTALDYDATLITNIGLDHNEILGDTLEQIAFEKAGIFKPNVPAISTEKKPECKSVMEQIAWSIQSPLTFAEVDYKKEKGKIVFTWQDHKYYLSQPRFQLDNLVLALECLKALDIEIKPKTIQSVIDAYTHKARYMIVREKPLLILDSAHNVAGIQALVTSIEHKLSTIYFCAMKEKDVAAMLALLSQVNTEIIWVDLDLKRSFDPKDLGLKVVRVEEVISDINNKEKDILVCGSIYLVGEVLQHL